MSKVDTTSDSSWIQELYYTYIEVLNSYSTLQHSKLPILYRVPYSRVQFGITIFCLLLSSTETTDEDVADF